MRKFRLAVTVATSVMAMLVGTGVVGAASVTPEQANPQNPAHTNRIVVREHGEFLFHQLYPEGWAVVEVTNPSAIERTVLGYRLYVEWPGVAFPGNIIVDAYPTRYKEARHEAQASRSSIGPRADGNNHDGVLRPFGCGRGFGEPVQGR